MNNGAKVEGFWGRWDAGVFMWTMLGKGTYTAHAISRHPQYLGFLNQIEQTGVFEPYFFGFPVPIVPHMRTCARCRVAMPSSLRRK